MSNLDLTDITKIGENDYGYEFAIGHIGGRWVGFALGRINETEKSCFFLLSISEGEEMGVKDKTLAILLTGAIAQSYEHGYGGIDRWFVGEELRGDPEAFRCVNCDGVGCDGKECQDGFFGYE